MRDGETRRSTDGLRLTGFHDPCLLDADLIRRRITPRPRCLQQRVSILRFLLLHEPRQLAAILPRLGDALGCGAAAACGEAVALRRDGVGDTRRKRESDDSGFVHHLDEDEVAAKLIVAAGFDHER